MRTIRRFAATVLTTSLLMVSAASCENGSTPVESDTQAETAHSIQTGEPITGRTIDPNATNTPTVSPETEPVVIRTPHDVIGFSDPFDNEARHYFEFSNTMSDEELQFFTDMFYDGWYYYWSDIEEETLVDYDFLHFAVALGDGMNFRPAWLYTSYDDPRDCNPYVACYWLKHEGFDINTCIDEYITDTEMLDSDNDRCIYGGAALLTPADVIEDQVLEFTGYSNSELSYPFAYTEYEGSLYVCDGPTRQGGYSMIPCLAGTTLDDGTVILLFTNDNHYYHYGPHSLAMMAPNGDGTYRILNNHRLEGVSVTGDLYNEVSSEDIVAGFEASFEQNMLDEIDRENNYDACLKFSVYLTRNTYLAAYGVIFEDPLLQFWFESCSWYQPLIEERDFDYSTLSDIELHNVEEADSLLAELQ